MTSPDSKPLFSHIEDLEFILDHEDVEWCSPADSKALTSTINDLKKTLNSMYSEELHKISKQESKKKKVTSVAIYQSNMNFIRKLQQESKNNSFFLSKEHIINMALTCLQEKYVAVGDVHELLDIFL